MLITSSGTADTNKNEGAEFDVQKILEIMLSKNGGWVVGSKLLLCPVSSKIKKIENFICSFFAIVGP